MPSELDLRLAKATEMLTATGAPMAAILFGPQAGFAFVVGQPILAAAAFQAAFPHHASFSAQPNRFFDPVIRCWQNDRPGGLSHCFAPYRTASTSALRSARVWPQNAMAAAPSIFRRFTQVGG